MDWKEAGLNQDSDILSFLVGKTLAILSLDVAQAIYTGDYLKLRWKPIQLGSVLAYEIAYVRMNRQVLNSALSISDMNTKPTTTKASVPEPNFSCATGFDSVGRHTNNTSQVTTGWDANSQTRQINMGFYSAIVNTCFSTIDFYSSMKGAGAVFSPPPDPTLIFLPVQAVLPTIPNPLYLAHQVPLPVAQYADTPDTPDTITNGMRYSKFGISTASSLALYGWLWYKNMKETGDFKCPAPNPPRTL